jgi:hypothetical protein
MHVFNTVRTLRIAGASALLALTAATTAEASVHPLPQALRNAASSVAFTQLDDPADPTFNQLLGINNKGVISGYFGSGAIGHPNIGYTIAPPYTTFESDNLPGSTQTQATGINNAGVTTGFWAPTNLGSGDANFGFVRSTLPLYIDINDPLVASLPHVNQVLGINDSNLTVGFYNDKNGNSHGFAYSLVTGKFMPVSVAFSGIAIASQAATGLNNSDLISGFLVKSSGNFDGYLKSLTSGTSVHFRFPPNFNTQFLGVNNEGVAVGFYNDLQGIPHGVVYNSVNGHSKALNDPNGAMGTIINGINDKGEAVGFYTDAAGNTHGMLITGITAP